MTNKKMIDSHLHFGDLSRLNELTRYIELLDLEGLLLLSLPLVGEGKEGAAIINFNPEVLTAAYLLSRKLETIVAAFGSLDNRRLTENAEGEPRDRPVGKWEPAAQVEELYRAGFSGLKLWEGKPSLQAALNISLDHPAFLAAYREAGSRGMPVLVHSGDPPVFWTSEEGPWTYVGRKVSPYQEFLRQADAICAAAPETTFIFPHLLFLAGDLERMAVFIEDHPNAYLDLAPGNYFYPRLASARDPRNPKDRTTYEKARSLFTRYAGKFLLGTDGFFVPLGGAAIAGTSLSENLERYARLLRFLSTGEIFGSPFPALPEEALILGLELSDEVLEKIGRENARRLWLSNAKKRREEGRAEGREADRAALMRYLQDWGASEKGETDDMRKERRLRIDAALKLIEEEAD
jgi:predicted TIM-barrel fold metal-dependent hydrolase